MVSRSFPWASSIGIPPWRKVLPSACLPSSPILVLQIQYRSISKWHTFNIPAGTESSFVPSTNNDLTFLRFSPCLHGQWNVKNLRCNNTDLDVLGKRSDHLMIQRVQCFRSIEFINPSNSSRLVQDRLLIWRRFIALSGRSHWSRREMTWDGSEPARSNDWRVGHPSNRTSEVWHYLVLIDALKWPGSGYGYRYFD